MQAVSDIALLYRQRGHEQYAGEPVTQLAHALQAALLAERDGADDELVTAALVHDIGHLLIDTGRTPALRGLDDRHQSAALPFLRGLFGHRLIDAVHWHVDAKRYLCFARTGYELALSEDSQLSLRLQGGVFDAESANDFIQRPGAGDAVRLREWDDLAKESDLSTPPIEHFLERAQRISLR